MSAPRPASPCGDSFLILHDPILSLYIRKMLMVAHLVRGGARGGPAFPGPCSLHVDLSPQQAGRAGAREASPSAGKRSRESTRGKLGSGPPLPAAGCAWHPPEKSVCLKQQLISRWVRLLGPGQEGSILFSVKLFLTCEQVELLTTYVHKKRKKKKERKHRSRIFSCVLDRFKT